MKHRVISFLLIAAILSSLAVTAVPHTVLAESASTEDPWYLSYKIQEGVAVVTDCDGSLVGEVVVPPTLGGYPVRRIGIRAFFGCYKITSVYIPDGVTHIEDFAFAYSFRITWVSLPKSLLLLGDRAFEGSDGLTDVYIRCSEKQWNSTIYGGNQAYWSATIHYLGCQHVWQEATCSTPKTCKECHLTEGTVADHTYNEAGWCMWCGFIPPVYGDSTNYTYSDAVYLLYHTMLPDAYPLLYNGDINLDGIVDRQDAIYLLYHVLLPDQYPIKKKSL